MDAQTKWTPGPWAVRQSAERHDGVYDFGISAQGAPVLAEAFGRDAVGGYPPAEANATLIAAAPELFDALQWLVNDVQDYEAWQRPCAAVDAARAALAKARGEAA